MKRIIFTTYDDLKIDDYTQNQIKEYHDRLIANKKEYAKSISVEFKYFHNTNDVHDLDFAKANLYKHYLMAELAKEYDEVMYVDLDIVFNTKLNVFEELDLSKGIHVKDQDDQILNKDIQKVLFKSVGKRSHTVKYHITKDLLDGKDNHVMNTGLMIGKSEHIKQIKYYDRMQEAIQLIDDIKSNNLEADMSYLRMSYYPNNESIFSYIMEKYNVPYVLMDQAWHHIVNEDEIADESHIIHFVNKKFNTFFKDKTKAIYSIYIEIPDDRLDNPRGPSDDPVNKSKRTKERFTEFTKRLFLNHREYAEFCNAKYICFQRDLQYETFRAQYPLLSEYDVINLYKVHLLTELTEIYDLVLYVDHDVVFNKSIDAFNFLKAESYLCCDT
jgi:lipopolysaccharide biosynthesis glycosyltransferase